MPYLKTTKLIKHSVRDCEECKENRRTRVVGLFNDDGEWLEEYGLCDSVECFETVQEHTVGDGQNDG